VLNFNIDNLHCSDDFKVASFGHCSFTKSKISASEYIGSSGKRNKEYLFNFHFRICYRYA